MTDETRTSDERPELTDEELEAQEAEQLPERAAMSLVTPDPTRPEIVLETEDGTAPNLNPFPKQSE